MTAHDRDRDALIPTVIRLPIQTWNDLVTNARKKDCSVSDIIRGMIVTTLDEFNATQEPDELFLNLYDKHKEMTNELHNMPHYEDSRLPFSCRSFHQLDYMQLFKEGKRNTRAICAQKGLSNLQLYTAIVVECVDRLKENPDLLEEYYQAGRLPSITPQPQPTLVPAA